MTAVTPALFIAATVSEITQALGALELVRAVAHEELVD
jgi:hypothetical protein